MVREGMCNWCDTLKTPRRSVFRSSSPSTRSRPIRREHAAIRELSLPPAPRTPSSCTHPARRRGRRRPRRGRQGGVREERRLQGLRSLDYDLSADIKSKIEAVLKNVYKAGAVEFSEQAEEKIKLLHRARFR